MLKVEISGDRGSGKTITARNIALFLEQFLGKNVKYSDYRDEWISSPNEPVTAEVTVINTGTEGS